MIEVHCAELPTLIDQEFGPSEWVTITQEMIDLYCHGVKDLEWIHVDVARAEALMGGTVVPGLMTLSLIPWLSQGMLRIIDRGTDLNYGYDQLRFLNVVHGGDRVRLRKTLRSVEPRGDGLLLTNECVIEVEGHERPALRALWKLLLFPGADAIPKLRVAAPAPKVD